MVIQYEEEAFTAATNALQKMSPHARGTLVLLVGLTPSETEQAASALAKSLEFDLHRVDLSRIVSKYIGATEKNLRALFEHASLSNVVLFFDEADALFGKRSEVKDSHDRHANLEASRLFSLLESYQGIMMLTVKSSTPLVRARNRRRVIIVKSSRRQTQA